MSLLTQKLLGSAALICKSTKTMLDIQVGNGAYRVEVATGSQELLTTLVRVSARTIAIKQKGRLDEVALKGEESLLRIYQLVQGTLGQCLINEGLRRYIIVIIIVCATKLLLLHAGRWSHFFKS